ncbi:MAG TPA: LLM class flavin-dependent oxidoreductase [Acidimicrobiia bacterium]|nr:LLM class flavin-dependent oxidoreductase [Acidimicrobiia bacterium]
MTGPFAPASVSLRSYPHDGLDAVDTIAELRAQAALAARAGFDGVMTSEHHAGFAGYLPNPLSLAAFLLDAMPNGWAAACPLLLPLRAPALVAEEVAWLAARFPGRVGLGVAAGALPVDFEIAGTTMDDLTARFASGLHTVARLLRGDVDGPLARDAAIARCRDHPIPILSAAASVTAARRAAANGCGLLFDSLSTAARCRELTDAYRDAGGDQPVVLVRRCWLGEPPPGAFDRQVAVYRGYAPDAATARWGSDELAQSTDAAVVVERLVAAVRDAGADALNLRVHVPGIEPASARAQIEALGEAVLPRVRNALATAAAR